MNIALAGADSVRIPVGDWMYLPYEPFIGCWDGALDELDRVLKLCHKHGLKAIIDIHGHRGSQVIQKRSKVIMATHTHNVNTYRMG
jgi:glucan 1,3-beta-glucosidase